jgi:hypothetical protein
MKTLKELFGKTESELLAEGWTINGLAIHKGEGSWAHGDGARAIGKGAWAVGEGAIAIGDGVKDMKKWRSNP